MYCPICGAEYRADFTFCADCQADLVADPPGNSSQAAFDNHDSFELVWSGADPRGHANACEILATEGIPARTISEQDHLLYATVSAPFEVFVPSAFAAKAKEILKAAHASEESLEQLAASGALEIPAEDEEDDRTTSNVARSRRIKYATMSGMVDENTPAASIVWTGNDFDIARMIEASLRENAIHFRTISDGAARTTPRIQTDPPTPVAEATSIFVLPEDEARAQEIVREITDATPPE